MASTSCKARAEALLACCLRGEPWPPELIPSLVADDCSADLFRIVAEGLADRFEPALCDAYARAFSEVIACCYPNLKTRRGGAGNLPAQKTPTRIFVLSRVTLGADVAITSIILDAAKRRFPQSEIILVGSRKSYELFAADSRIQHLEIAYPRTGSLRERLGTWQGLRDRLSIPNAITVDPDSRLTQLGLLPVCPEESYYFFETRSYGGDTDATLGQLTRDWVRATFGVPDARAYISPHPIALNLPRPIVTISLGVGENPAKSLPDPFESNLLRGLIARGASLYIDSGGGGEEAERVERAAASSGAPPQRIEIARGSFAAFASAIAQSDLYAGYDSAGQHVAAACGVPLVTVFAGFASERMLSRWRPDGPGKIEVVRADRPNPDPLAAVDRLGIL